MRYSGLQVVFQEIPTEVSLAIHIVGCPLRCLGCHSSDLWAAHTGIELNEKEFLKMLGAHEKYISCVLFMGGEWESKTLIHFLKLCRYQKFKTALYTGLDFEEISEEILQQLDYVKYGRFIINLGGLNSPTTNQILLDLNKMENMNHYFKEGVKNDQTDRRANTKQKEIC